MNKILLLIAFILFHSTSAMATFSIDEIGPRTGDLGVAVPSRYFDVGTVARWAEPDVANCHIPFGFVTYLKSKIERLIIAFDRAKESTLLSQLKTKWDAVAGNANFKKVVEDKTFVTKVAGN